jgi:ABC-type antimicrobial peptide transport system permease subunit
MMNLFLKIFSEESTISLMRIMSAIAFIVGISLLIIDAIVTKDISNTWIGALSYSGGGKVTQKFAEMLGKGK